MTVLKERAVDMISRMPEEKLYYVVQLLESVEGLSENWREPKKILAEHNNCYDKYGNEYSEQMF